MDAAQFDYTLPPDRIAQCALPERDACKLLVVDRATRQVEHVRFRDITRYLRPSDLLFRNAAKVLPARIHAQRPTGGQVECLLLRKASESSQREASSPLSSQTRPAGQHPQSEAWWCLLRPGKRLPHGSTFGIEDEFVATVLDKNDQAEYLVAFDLHSAPNVASLAERCGKMPLPPYIKRERLDPLDRRDLHDYQTVYADSTKTVAAAAPTAGLHFTPDLEARIAASGAEFHELILHVGMGTFKPLDDGPVSRHQIHTELYEIPHATQFAYREASSTAQRRICIGTTSVRSLEDYQRKGAPLSESPFVDQSSLFLYPPTAIESTDCLVTNFHLPRSTLLCLVASFLTPNSTDGIEWLKQIYQEAIDQEYRFLSYGDAMLIL